MTEKITKEIIEAWTNKHDWLQTGEQATSTGRQVRYLCPSGDELFVLYDLAGNMTATGRVPIPMQIMQQPTMGPLPPGFFAGKQ